MKCSGQIPKSITIRAGSTSHQKGGSIVQVKRLIQNEKYNSTQHDYDFGLIELTDKLNFSNNIQSIALPTTKDDVKNGTICSVYSWGNLPLRIIRKNKFFIDVRFNDFFCFISENKLIKE